MSAAPLQELVDGKAMVVPLTVDQYHRMLETGILEEGAPIELLDGFLVRKDRSETGENSMTIGHEHAFIIGKLVEVLSPVLPAGTCLRVQQPITLLPDNEPEPDLVIARGRQETYRNQHPSPQDVLSVIEVSDSSLERDRTTKQRIYAAHAIPQYLIINLVDGVIEEYLEPLSGPGRYARRKLFHRGDSVPLHMMDNRTIDLSPDTLFS